MFDCVGGRRNILGHDILSKKRIIMVIEREEQLKKYLLVNKENRRTPVS